MGKKRKNRWWDKKCKKRKKEVRRELRERRERRVRSIERKIGVFKVV